MREMDKTEGSGPRRNGVALLKRDSLFVALLLAVVFAAFYPALKGGFIKLDDYACLVENPHYRGLGFDNLKWMFTTVLTGPYQPLTWISFALDHFVWGLNPFGYHLTNLLLHCLNAVLFYFISARLLAASLKTYDAIYLRRAAWAAACLFAAHPLRVESVAWIAERKDVLSGAFYLFAIYAYLRYCALAESRGSGKARGWLAAAFIVFVAGLMAKGMLISLPAALIILDIYPLRRLSIASLLRGERRNLGVALEKIPFFFAAVVFAVIGYAGQKVSGALTSIPVSKFAERLAQPAYGVVFYLWKTVLPAGLSPYYERARNLDPFALEYLLSGMAVLAVSACFVALARKRPYFLAVWAHYVVTLLPVLGFMPFGPQLVADRYSYLACLGWPLLVCGSALWWISGPGAKYKALLMSVVAAIILPLAVMTWRQTRIWNSTESVLRRAFVFNRDSWFLHYNYGTVLYEAGRKEEAMGEFRAMIKAAPANPQGYNSLGCALMEKGRPDEALPYLRTAVGLKPDDAKLRVNLAGLLGALGRRQEAVDEYLTALKLDPSLDEAYISMGAAMQSWGRQQEAQKIYERALAVNPENYKAYNNLGVAAASQGDFRKAMEYYEKAIRLRPGLADPHRNWGDALAARKQYDQAITHYQAALTYAPEDTQASISLGDAWFALEEYGKAEDGYTAALKINPGDPNAFNKRGVARMLLDRRSEAVEDFRKAVSLAPASAVANRNLERALDADPQ